MSTDRLSRFVCVCAVTALTLSAAGTAWGQMFQKTYGTPREERSEWVQQTSDGGYIIVGWRGVDTGVPHTYVIKIDSSGVLQWDNELIGSDIDVATSVVEVADGYVIAGETRSSGDPTLGMSLIKLDLAGNLLWSWAYPGTAFAGGSHNQTSLEPSGASDGGFILGGRQQLINNVSQAPILVRTDAAGNMIWARYYVDFRFLDATFASFADVHPYVTSSGEAGLLAVGYTDGPTRETLRVATDMAGVVQWAKTYDLPNHTDFAMGLDVAANGQILISGFTKAIGEGGGTFVMRADQLGSVLWYNTYRIFSSTNSMLETPLGEIVLAGNVNDFGAINDPAIMLLDSAGNHLWTMAYGGANQEFGECVVPTTDGGYKLAAWTNSFGQGLFDFYSIKTDSAGVSGCNEQPITQLVGNDFPEQNVPIRDFAIDPFAVFDLNEIDPPSIEEDLCPTGCICPADLNGDCQVDLSDLAILLANFGTPAGATLADGDIDGDGDVDLSDLALLLAAFGTIC